MKVIWISTAALLALPLMAAFGVATQLAGGPQTALADIPSPYLALYREAGAQFGVAWQLLAAVGKVESDHGRNPDAMRANAAGAIGPMQFLPATFAAYGHAAGHPHPDILDPRDAIFAAAALLSAAGVQHDARSALWAYNHSSEYVDLVLRWAGAYGYGQVNAIRANVVRLAQAHIGKPYIWGATGPNGFDCSGLVRFVFGESGIRLPRTAQQQYDATLPIHLSAVEPGDLVFLKLTYPTTAAEPITHVAIFVGERKVITAPNVGARVRVESIDDPYWQAHWAGAEAQRLAGIGYAGVDIALDSKRGPVVMEVNRRPGLEIQNANAAGLLRRLRVIEQLPHHELPVEERLKIVQRLDGENWGIQTGKPITRPELNEEDFEGHRTGAKV